MKLIEHKQYIQGQSDGMKKYRHNNKIIYAANTKDAWLRYKAGLFR